MICKPRKKESQTNQLITTNHNLLIKDIRLLIDQVKPWVAKITSFEMKMIYYHIASGIM